MTEAEERYQMALKETGKWKNRAVEAAKFACYNCEEYQEERKKDCSKCRMQLILAEAGGQQT